MQITRLRLSGFKSFVDPADLRIEPGLTGIVGPNGCGKSNLLEALRWTMGETSARSLRGAGMDDVIFAGTATRPARDFAEVAMLLDVAGDETEVVRRIERGAGSAYRIDGRDVRARDVGLLFADAATGAHSPALVSQGRIGAVIAAKPGERRAMLEEAAGIAGLHLRRKDAEAKLRATEANLTRLDELIADQAARANALRRQARLAERYRRLSEQIRVAEARLIFARWRDAQGAADTAKIEAAACETRLAAAAEAQRAAAAYVAAATDTLAAARVAALAAREAASEAGHRLGGLRAEHTAAVRRASELVAARVALAADRAREGILAHDAAEAMARIGDETGSIEAALAANTARLPEFDARLAEVERDGRDAEVALAQALGQQATEAADARVAGAALAAARERTDRAARDLARASADIAALPDTAALTRERAAAAAARDAAAHAATSARDALTRADAAERGAREQRDDAEAARAAALAELTALDSEVAALTRATVREGRARVLDAVRPAPGYERALAAALGDDLEAGLDPAAERFWGGAAPVEGDPPAPPETVALFVHVEAPAALARRLAQVFVAVRDTGQPLAIGQRLVTLGGALRRWDGYVAKSGGAAAAERLERLRRLRTLEETRPAAARTAEETAQTVKRIDAVIVDARSLAVEQRRTLDRSETAMRDALRVEDRAAAAVERIEAQRGDLAQRRHRSAQEHDDAAADLARADEIAAALPDGRATRERVAACAGFAEAARAAVALARAEHAGLDRETVRTRARLVALAGEAKGWRSRAGEAGRRIADLDRRDLALTVEAEALRDRPETLAQAVVALESGHAAARAEADAAASAERTADASLRAAERPAAAAAEALATAREARAGAFARAEHQELRRVEMNRLAGERFQCPSVVLPERVGFDSATIRAPTEESAAHDTLQRDRERIGPVNLVAERELAELDASALGNATEREELGLAVNRLRGSIGTLNREGRQRLRAAFEAVDGHFRRLFTTLFDGGAAHLELIDSDDPLEAGLEIMAQPPGKKLQSLTLLSGGEQALTAVALIFGLFLTNPAPLCVLDEVDAPLDDANIERFCDLLDAMTRETHTRYLIVTHNAVTMSRMHRLFGVTMVEPGVSRLVSVDLGGAETLLAAA